MAGSQFIDLQPSPSITLPTVLFSASPTCQQWPFRGRWRSDSGRVCASGSRISVPISTARIRVFALWCRLWPFVLWLGFSGRWSWSPFSASDSKTAGAPPTSSAPRSSSSSEHPLLFSFALVGWRNGECFRRRRGRGRQLALDSIDCLFELACGDSGKRWNAVGAVPAYFAIFFLDWALEVVDPPPTTFAAK